jgi:putative nucleotidyltransferase with HDIG domain
MLNDHSHEVAQSTRALVAEALDDRRVETANGIVASIRSNHEAVSPLIVRALVHTLAKALADGSADPIVHWARMVRHAHPAPLVIAVIDAACAAAENIAYEFNGDLGTLIVFLEIVKERTRAIMNDEPTLLAERDGSGLSAIQSLLAMLRARDDATCNHSQATGDWARRIAQRLGLPHAQTERAVRAGVLHDIGKIRIPDAILFKEGSLAVDEWEIMKRHAEAGAAILSEIPTLAQYAPIVGAHHERFDGRGYPNGLAGEEISLEARIVSVADSFHAMVTDRPYRKAFTYGEAIAILDGGRGTQWDSEIVGVMIALAVEDRNRAIEQNLAHASELLSDLTPIHAVSEQSEAV